MNSDKIIYLIVAVGMEIIFIFTPIYITTQNNKLHTVEMFEIIPKETVELISPPTYSMVEVDLEPEPSVEPEVVIIEEIIETPSVEAIMIAKVIFGEARGVESVTEQACIAWTILNRVDSEIFKNTIAEVILAPHQFCYTDSFSTVDDYGRDLVALAEDVIERWEREKAGEIEVGRVLPKEYCYYGGDGKRNWFRTDYYDLNTKWYYECGSPYES